MIIRLRLPRSKKDWTKNNPNAAAIEPEPTLRDVMDKLDEVIAKLGGRMARL